VNVPADLRYTPTHEWVRMEGGMAVVGITEFAVHAIKDVVFLELPDVGRKLEAGKPFGVVESVKAVFDLNCPVSGEVAEVNTKAAEDFTLLQDAYGKGWLLKVRAAGLDLSQSMDAAAYQTHCANEHH
jgi:glycine cleavage system H protein